MKRISALCLSAVLLITVLAGCGKTSAKRNLFNVTLKEGKVQDGDTANNDYVGKKDGVAFEGGSAEGYDLEIGSGSFIDGFETGLIGAQIGKTVDLNLTFPKEYKNNPDLAGAKVVFTVTVNSVKRPKAPEDYYKDLKFETLKAYENDAKERAVKGYLSDAVAANAKVIKSSDTDVDAFYNSSIDIQNEQLKSYNIDFETYLSYYGMTLEAFKEQAAESVDRYMIFYAILDKENIACTQTEIDKCMEEIAKESNTDSATVKKSYGEINCEVFTVLELVEDFLYKNAEIK